MDHDTRVFPDPDALAFAAAQHVALAATRSVESRGSFDFAVSGGRTPWEMFSHLRGMDMPWSRTNVFQVDERFAPDGDPARNLTHLRKALGDVPATVVPMDAGVDPDNVDSTALAARSYASALPAAFDLVHLGLGPDGHTASLIPGDPILEEMTDLVGCTGMYQGHRRITLTYPGLALAAQLMWVVSGTSKQDALSRLLSGDESIPAGRVVAGESVVMADADAMSDKPSGG